MHSPPLQSRSSFDLPLSTPHSSRFSKRTELSAPRLHHSPSLPNICFPPYSRQTMSVLPPDNAQTPDPPQPPPKIPHEKYTLNDMASSLDKLSFKASEPCHTHMKTPHSYTRRRQRRDRDTSQHLLTPPLTPSSSIRTSASTDSADPKPDDKLQALHELQEPQATRFLYLENVSRTVAPNTLQSTITAVLDHLAHRRAPNVLPPADQSQVPAADSSCIKGFFMRHTKTTGALFLAFHDVRDAIAAHVILSQRTDGALAECLGEDKLIDGAQAWFRCRFIAAEKLVKTIGNSNFLATTDGAFLLSVGVAVHTGTDGQGAESKCPRDVHTLVKLLESYGNLRLFKPQLETGETQNYLVEFFDIRDASEAYAALNDLSMFGMKFCTSGRVPQDPSEANGALDSPHNQDHDRPDTPLSSHQPSASESHIPKLRPLIGPPGEASHMRGRFISDTTRSRPRAASVGNNDTSPNSPPRPSDHQPKASSPTIFYTSFGFSDSFPAVPRSAEEKSEEQTIQQDDHYPEADSVSEQQMLLQQACSSPECRYCPSRGHDSSNVTAQPFNHHQMNAPFIHPLSFPAQSPPHVFVAPEYEGLRAFPQPTGWSFDPHMIAPPPASNVDVFTPAFIPTIPVVPVEHRFPPESSPNSAFIQNNRLVFPTISPALHVVSPAPVPPFVCESPSSLNARHTIFVTHEPILQQADVDLKLATSNASSVHDRNFLNTARIEEGLDTRTTVMIKNIPNKMTAKDLIQYINDVCPRKIDFLYLRMDFKNGCNVGYAFVNFIRVQDMLRFAKKRLGIKWNLFSSEKVLQMSYANYQGKEALVEKFKNSCIMDEREEWRPKIFYSSGPEQGLPEPFPAPTHLRRKERSSHNRGALYVPGTPTHVGCSAAGVSNGHMGHHGSLRRQDFYTASSGSGRYLEHRTRSVDR